jgi:gluconolactonase
VQCIAPDGTKLGAINVPFQVSNLAFGGRNRSRLFICASHTLFAIFTNQRGALRP